MFHLPTVLLVKVVEKPRVRCRATASCDQRCAKSLVILQGFWEDFQGLQLCFRDFVRRNADFKLEEHIERTWKVTRYWWHRPWKRQKFIEYSIKCLRVRISHWALAFRIRGKLQCLRMRHCFAPRNKVVVTALTKVCDLAGVEKKERYTVVEKEWSEGWRTSK